MEAKPYDTTGGIIAYENGELTEEEELELFSNLVRTGLAWSLQGAYGRHAGALIAGGYLDNRGVIQ